jgi:dissimilatory sulfite reductase (desulfoviridin) alpha/beta subunit
MKKIELKIPGGILSVSFLRNLCLMLHSYNIENIYLGNRQNIILYVKRRKLRKVIFII